MTLTPDTIKKQVHLKAPRERVWRAVSDSKQFGAWFGMHCDTDFVAGTKVSGHMVPTSVDPAIAEQQKPFEGARVVLFIERVEPMDLLSFRWHPSAEVNVDDPDAPTTLVTFTLQDADGGTLLTVSESGFDKLPPQLRAKAFAENEGGWQAQTELIRKYLEHAS